MSAEVNLRYRIDLNFDLHFILRSTSNEFVKKFFHYEMPACRTRCENHDTNIKQTLLGARSNRIILTGRLR
jgi:hypothetical protein